MNLFAPMIRRPAGTSLLAIGLAIAGFCAYLLLGVAAFPSIEFPGVAVFAQLPGASAQTMASTVVAPLERHLGRIPGVRQMYSSASEGGAQIQILFEMDRTADKAAASKKIHRNKAARIKSRLSARMLAASKAGTAASPAKAGTAKAAPGKGKKTAAKPKA